MTTEGQGGRPQGGPSRRTERMSDLIRQEIANFLIKGNKNPMIGFVTITNVTMTPDLHAAKVYYTAYGSDKEIAETKEGLEESSSRIRGHLAKVLKVRHMPTIEFIVDEGLEHSMKIQTLLGSLNNSEDQD